MDFFEAQARAKKRTARLVALFTLALAGTIGATYISAVFGVRALNENRHTRRDSRYEDSDIGAPVFLWQPRLFLGVTSAVLAIVGIASLAKWSQFSSGGSAVAESVNGRRVDPHTTDLNERRLLNVVEEMAIAAGLPVPAVYLLDDEPAINAFAAGLTTSDAVIAVTRGTLDKLSRDELQGVIGHEFSHVLNGDMRLNLRLTALLFGILVLGLAGRGILWSLRGARFSSRGSKNSGGVVVAILVVGIALLIIGYVGYFFGRIIQAAVSRQREFLADASSIQFTRNPAGLTGALKKIGGYELGSRLQTSKAAAIGHFFFAQSFRSGITGLWSTHPPLTERIRAIDPQFDGEMFEPPEIVHVAEKSFVSAGLAPPPLEHETNVAAFNAAATIASIGTLGPAQIAAAEDLLASIPVPLREATRSAESASALVYALVFAAEPDLRARQRALIDTRDGSALLATVDRLVPALENVDTLHKLPLLQLALPALRTINAEASTKFLATLDQLILADNRVSPFEFALQKILTRTLVLSRDPRSHVIQIYSFNAVVEEISIVLSAVAHASSADLTIAASAFSAGAAQIKLIEKQLAFVTPESANFGGLGAALDKLAAASGPIKQRVLLAAAHVVSADKQVLANEAELLRVISAALDCPMPPLARSAAN
jgi:Zn-dependent protease with chaperone function